MIANEITYEDTCTVTITENTTSQPVPDDYTALDVSIIQKGQPFTLYDGALDLNEQTVFADITLDDSIALQNVLSVGLDISQWVWATGKFHCYYPRSLTDSTRELEFDFGHGKSYVTITNNEFKMALNANGVYVNGAKMNDISQSGVFTSLVDQKTAQIGSLQGSIRSKATYNIVGIYDRLLSSEELVTLTSIDA